MIHPASDFRVSKRFELGPELGRGGSGVVFQAYDREWDEVVALKTMRRVGARSLFRIKHEFRLLADLVHPNLVPLYELFVESESCYFTMELIEGRNFVCYVRNDQVPPDVETATYEPPDPARAQQLAGTSVSGPQLTEDQFDRLRQALVQLANGLTALHDADKLHRDIKPSNVLVANDGRVVLLDFGLVTEVGGANDDLDHTKYVVGTVGYIAPERLAGEPPDPASDWYSVGVLLYATLTGRLPDRRRSREACGRKQNAEAAAPVLLAPSTPADLNEICTGLLRKCPDERLDGNQLLDLLEMNRPAANDDVPMTLHPRKAPFVGRRQHLRTLQEAFAQSKRDKTVVVGIEGESGVGKTALLDHFLGGIMASGAATVLGGRCYQRELVPYKALDSLIDSLSTHLKSFADPWAAGLQPSDLEALARLFPVLHAIGGRDRWGSAPSNVSVPDKQEMRRRAFAALRHLLASLSRLHPLVLYIDDLQWGDVDSAALLSDVLAVADAPSLLLLACYRSEDKADSQFLQGFLAGKREQNPNLDWRVLEVSALSDEETRSLALEVLGKDTPQAREIADTAVRECGGNAYFVTELLHQWTAPSARHGQRPGQGKSSLGQLLKERVEQLSDDARRLLEIVAVAGKPLPQKVARSAADLEAQQQCKALALLCCGHFMRTGQIDDDNSVETYHDKIRETVAGMLSEESLADRHRSLALALESSRFADTVTLAEHFEGAKVYARAGELYAVAAEEAAEALAFDRAARLFRKALALRPADVAKDQSLRTKLGDALANAGRGAEAAEEYLAAAVGAAAADRLELERRAAMQSLISGHIDEGLESLAKVLQAVHINFARTPWQALLEVLWQRLQLRIRGLHFKRRDTTQVTPEQLTRLDVCWSAGIGLSNVDTIRGASFQTRSLLLSLRVGEPYRVARALAWESAHVSTGGRRAHRRAQQLLGRAKQLAEEIDHPHALGMVKLSGAVCAFMNSEWRPGRDLADEAAELFRSRCTGVTWEIDTARTFALWSLLFLGEVGDICRRIPVYTKEARERGNLYAAHNSGTFAGHLTWLADDDPAGAHDDLESMMRLWSRQGFHVQHVTGLMGRTQTDLYAGNGSAAWERLQREWPSLKKSYFLRIQTVRIYMLHLRGRSALLAASQATNPKTLLRAARRDIARLRREKLRWARAMASLLSAGLAVLQNDHDTALQHLGDALPGYEETDMSLFAAVTRRRIGEIMMGERGKQMITEADTWMRNENIKNPARMTDMHTPGFPKAEYPL